MAVTGNPPENTVSAVCCYPPQRAAMDDFLEKLPSTATLAYLQLLFRVLRPSDSGRSTAGILRLSRRQRVHASVAHLDHCRSGKHVGITVSYWICRFAGHEVVHRFGRYVHLTEDRLLYVQHWFDRIGHWLLTIGYYIPGVRHFTAVVAGMSGMRYRAFAPYAYSGAVCGCLPSSGLGMSWEIVGKRFSKGFTKTCSLSSSPGLSLPGSPGTLSRGAKRRALLKRRPPAKRIPEEAQAASSACRLQMHLEKL